MSQSKAKKERREAKQREQEKPSVNKPMENQSGFGGMLRKAATYVLAGTLAAGGLDFIYKQAPFWFGEKPEYTLKVVFLRHNNVEDALRLVNGIDSDEKGGKRYLIQLDEEADSLDSGYMKVAKKYEAEARQARAAYNDAINKGYSQDYAVDYVRRGFVINGIGSQTTFQTVVFADAALRYRYRVAFESHSSEEAARYARDGPSQNTWPSELAKLVEANAPLRDIAKHEMDERSTFYEHVEERNQEIARTIKHRLDVATWATPRLWAERWIKGNTINAIAWMGNMHTNLRTDIKEQNYDKSMEFSYEDYQEHMFTIRDRILESITAPRRFTEREAYILAIEDWGLDGAVQGFYRQGRSDVAETLISNVLALKIEDLKRIDEETEDMTREQRARFIMNTIYGGELIRDTDTIVM